VCVGTGSSFRDSCTPVAPPSYSQRAISYSLLFGMMLHSSICNPAAARWSPPLHLPRATVFRMAKLIRAKTSCCAKAGSAGRFEAASNVAALTRLQTIGHFGQITC
jgi:hypothetical protein